MESNEDDEEIQASFCRFLDDNFKLPISAYAPGCEPKVEFKERLFMAKKNMITKEEIRELLKSTETFRIERTTSTGDS